MEFFQWGIEMCSQFPPKRAWCVEVQMSCCPETFVVAWSRVFGSHFFQSLESSIKTSNIGPGNIVIHPKEAFFVKKKFSVVSWCAKILLAEVAKVH
jgi:hypothetical protein